MFQAEARRQVCAQCLHAVTLGGMVSGGDESHPRLLCDMHVLF